MSVEFSVCDSPDDFARLAADVVETVVRGKPDAAIGFATGGTPRGLYSELAARVEGGTLDLSQVRGFALDEYVGLAPEDERSFAAYLGRHVIRPLRLTARRFAPLDGSTAPPAVLAGRCVTHERAIRVAGGLDLQIVGLGTNAHLAFNEPGSSFESRTRVAALSPSTRRANAASFGTPADVPAFALTLGLATIVDARMILLVAAGDEKADAVAAAFDGPIDPSCPASLLQRHRDVRAVLDPAAASGLSRRGRGFPTVLETHA